ncbi:PP-loop family protein [Brevundimonas vitis]|uniref:tRNA(Ile)-lysidine synthetase n=2 Tax=Brevundimonas vitisensis TaxID=2800818 RepID=A0ABX7BQY6_9CAUL|nr:PP-loop family protein [Brevundimonas vitisensis]
MALLALAADWARSRGRRLLALTVDHGLTADSANWTELAGRAARRSGAAWQGLSWNGVKPVSGLPAAARAARHALIAEAARMAGADVVLFAHTADDVRESQWMRQNGSTLGRLSEWSPSPAWPEGRGLMLFRPLLDVARAELRALLTARGLDWIEDPANADLRFARSRARLALGRLSSGGSQVIGAARGLGPCQDWSSAHGVVQVARNAPGRVVSAALVCAGGGDRLPRSDRLQSVTDRLRAGHIFTATLCGARIMADGDKVIVAREPGEFGRRPTSPVALGPGQAVVWDGRFEIETAERGWRVGPAVGRMAQLSPADRAELAPLPPAARAAWPVLIRDGDTAPVLAQRQARVRSLVEGRLALALDQTTHERDLGHAVHGAKPSNALFSCEAFMTDVA